MLVEEESRGRARSWESSHVRELSVGGRSVSKQTSLNVYRTRVLLSWSLGYVGFVVRFGSPAVYEHADPKYVMKGLFHSRCQFDVFFVMPEIDIFVSSKGNFNISTLDHMKKLKNNAFVGNTILDNEIDFAGSKGLE